MVIQETSRYELSDNGKYFQVFDRRLLKVFTYKTLRGATVKFNRLCKRA